jgi:hypothetical protein
LGPDSGPRVCHQGHPDVAEIFPEVHRDEEVRQGAARRLLQDDNPVVPGPGVADSHPDLDRVAVDSRLGPELAWADIVPVLGLGEMADAALDFLPEAVLADGVHLGLPAAFLPHLSLRAVER